MAPKGANRIAESGLAPIFALGRPIATAGLPDASDGAVTVAARSLGGFQKEALVTAAQGRDWRLVCDEGPYLNGHDAAPCPLAFFSVGLAAGYLAEIAALATARGLLLADLCVEVESWYSSKGSMAARTMVGGAAPPQVRVSATCAAGQAAVQALAADALRSSALTRLLACPVPGVFRLFHNGATIGRDAGMAAAPEDPSTLFDDLCPAPADAPLVAPIGPTRRKPVSGGTSAAGSSLADTQDRTLNIGARARFGADGLTLIDQFQYSPWGTSFRFVSGEATGRAPDALTLIAAGLAFCFMTQFGRFASMTGATLVDYRIVQSMRFATRPDTQAAAPVETTVFLDTPETEETARDMLETARRTCFLHALCGAALRPRLATIPQGTAHRT
jgi:uncharacterized OsmC-like protein